VTKPVGKRIWINSAKKINIEYEYDGNGNMRKDINKHLDSIRYNQPNLPEEITFKNGNKIKYFYDASGTKWRKIVTDSAAADTTDYVGSLILENDTLKLIQTAEGRIVTDTTGQGYSYHQYYLKVGAERKSRHAVVGNHLGNVRLTFGAEPDTTVYTATMESERASEEEAEFVQAVFSRQ